MSDRAVECLRAAIKAGFVCAPETLRQDPWLEVVRGFAKFGELMREAESRVQAVSF